MNTKTSISTNRYDEKALFSLPTCRLYFSLSYCLITTQVIVIKRIRHYQIVLMQWLITTPRLIGIYTHKVLSPIILSTKEREMRSRYNVQIVRVEMPILRIYAKVFKYIMLATVTGCAIQSTLILTQLAERVL